MAGFIFFLFFVWLYFQALSWFIRWVTRVVLEEIRR